MIVALAAAASALVLGALAVASLWPRQRSLINDWVLLLAWGMGVGLGGTSILFFFNSLVFADPSIPSAIQETICTTGLSLFLWRRRRSKPLSNDYVISGFSWAVLCSATLAFQAILVGALVVFRSYALESHGGWDGWAIWTMHARFFFRAREHWPELLTYSTLAWTHTDYPLLVSASVARVWSFAGEESSSGAALISILFGVSTLALLMVSIGKLKGALIACMGGALLIGTPTFLSVTPIQCADIPLGLYVLSTIAGMAYCDRYPDSRGMPILTGLCAGEAAWTKNEGILFALIATVVWLAVSWVSGSRRSSLYWLVGLSLAMIPVAIFKVGLAPANDIVSGGTWHQLGNLMNPQRHVLILSAFRRDVLSFGSWSVVPYMAMALPLVVGRGRLGSQQWTPIAVILLLAAGYYAVYLLTPWDLQWHLDSSLVRLLLHIWPATIFVWCLIISTPVEAMSPTIRPAKSQRTRLISFALVNASLALGFFWSVNQQLARDELGAGYVKGKRISVLLDQGWYGQETHGKRVWSWSRGNATLVVNVPGKTPVSVNLKFGAVSVVPRKLRLVLSGRVLLSTQVESTLQPISVENINLEPGLNTIELQTDLPPVKSPRTNDEREFGFALHSMKVN